MIRANASFVLGEFATIINDTIEHFQDKGQIKSLEQKEVLKFELTAFVFWLFQTTNIFPEIWHKLLLDEIHNQYFDRLRKHGYDFEMRQLVCQDFILRNKAYNDIMREDEDFSRVGAKFVRFLTERSKTDWDIKNMMIPLYITEKLTPKFKEFRDTLNN